MNAQFGCSLAATIGVLLGAVEPALAQSEPEAQWTVLTVAGGGAWGLSTARSQGEAIAGALRQCRSRSAAASDCGAELVAYRVGWSLAILCGDHRVLVTGESREDAEAAAAERIAALKEAHAYDLPTCRRLLTVDSAGAVTIGMPRELEKVVSASWPD